MENPQGTSFIPKTPTRATVRPQGVRRVYIFTYVSFIFFFGTIVATVGTFVWDIAIDKQLEVQKEALNIERELFNSADLEKVRDLDTRMNVALTLLNKHVSVLNIFEALEESTLSSVEVVSFEYIKQPDKSIAISLGINTKNFNESLFQREIFSSNGILSNSTTSALTFSSSEVSDGLGASNDKDEVITYTVTKILSPSDIPYVVATSINEETTSVSADLTSDTTDELTATSSVINSGN